MRRSGSLEKEMKSLSQEKAQLSDENKVSLFNHMIYYYVM